MDDQGCKENLITESSTVQPKGWFHTAHRKITRLKIIGICVIFLLSILFIAVFCLSGSVTRSKECSIPLHSPPAKKRLPHSIIIGVRKAGTGALRHFLGLHPDIGMATKEPNFFGSKYNRGFDWYLSLMPYTVEGQITMEKSSNNFQAPKAPERTFMMNSTIKLIVVVREPVERAISDYTQRVINNKNKKTFEDAFYDLKSKSIKSDYNCIKPSLYYKHMLRWMKFFPRNQIHVVDGGNLRKNPYEEVYKVENFLGLGHRISRDTFVFNETKGFYCFKHNTGQVECLRDNKGRKHIPVKPGVIRMLKQYFRPLNTKFYHLVGHHFDW